MATNKLETLSEVFNEKIFRIPDYQRGYAWGKLQLEDFWSDLANLDQDRIHYTGMITVENKPEKGYFHVVDGQQRLTTIMILLKIILDNFEDDAWLNGMEKNDYVKKYLFRKTGKNHQDVMVVFGYEKDNPSDYYYKTEILKLDYTEICNVARKTLYTNNLKNAQNFFLKKTKGLGKNALETLFHKLTTQLKFNFYEIDDELDEFVAFETMNNRGKPLTTLELLKNRLIYLTTLLPGNDDNEIEKLRGDINNAWKTIYEYLGKNTQKIINDDKFLKDHWIMYFTYDRGIANVEKDFLLNKYFTQQRVQRNNNHILGGDIGYRDIKDYVFNIQKAVTHYYYMENPNEAPYSEEIKKWLSKLNRIGFKAFKPLFMAVFTQEVDNSNTIKLLKLAESYVFLVFYIFNRRADTGNSRIYGYANDFHKDKSVDKLIENISKELYDEDNLHMYRWTDIATFENTIVDNYDKSQGWYSWKGLHYILYEYELFLQENLQLSERKLQWEEVNKESIEHIYPQTANDPFWLENFHIFSNQQKHKICHSLGNLLLLSRRRNSTLQNKSFEEKKEYFESGSYSEIEVSQNVEWNPEKIEERGRKILCFLADRWQLEIPEQTIEKLIPVFRHSE